MKVWRLVWNLGKGAGRRIAGSKHLNWAERGHWKASCRRSFEVIIQGVAQRNHAGGYSKSSFRKVMWSHRARAIVQDCLRVFGQDHSRSFEGAIGHLFERSFMDSFEGMAGHLPERHKLVEWWTRWSLEQVHGWHDPLVGELEVRWKCPTSWTSWTKHIQMNVRRQMKSWGESFGWLCGRADEMG